MAVDPIKILLKEVRACKARLNCAAGSKRQCLHDIIWPLNIINFAVAGRVALGSLSPHLFSRNPRINEAHRQ